MANILIVYYSRKGENYWNGGIRNLTKGNTEIVAEMIQRTVGGDCLKLTRSRLMQQITMNVSKMQNRNSVVMRVLN